MRILIYITLILIFPQKVFSQPDFDTKRTMFGVNVYADYILNSQYYYAPGRLKLVVNNDGRPDFKFIQMRYTGTRARADQGVLRFKSLLKFSIKMTKISARLFQQIKSQLEVNGKSVSLKPLPLHKIESLLVYVTANDHGKYTDNTQKLTGGYFSEATAQLNLQGNTLWTDRLYTIRLDNASSQLFWNAFHNKQTILSVGYAYYAKGIHSHREEVIFQGNQKWLTQFEEQFPKSLKDSVEYSNQPAPWLIWSDAFQITVDCQQYPDLLEQIDINEKIPPDFAALDIYCYDFNNNIRPDLYAKKVEIQAIGTGRIPVSTKVTFRENTPDIYAQNVRFKHAIRLEYPLKYRITEISKDGDIRIMPWKTRKSWHEILDVTHKGLDQ